MEDNKRFKICIIDDDQVYLTMLVKILNSSDIHADIRQYQSGNVFIENLKSDYLPDLCLIDIGLETGLNGYNICRMIKQNKKYKDISVIFITGYNDEESIAQAYECGASDYIAKPFNKVELIMRIKTQLDLKETMDQLVFANYSLRKLNQKYKYELRLARNVQRGIMMNANKENEFFDIAYIFKPHFNLGGDYLDAIPLRDKKFAVIIGDMAGHGVATALKVALVKSFIITNIYRETSPSLFLQKLNSFLINELINIELNYMSMFFGIYDSSVKSFIYSSAGHPFMLYYNSIKKDFEDIGVTGCPLGIDKNADFDERAFVAREDDRLVLFSDGLLDITDRAGEFITIEQFKKFFLQDKLIESDVNVISEKLNSYLMKMKSSDDGEGEEFNDDISVMLVRFKR